MISILIHVYRRNILNRNNSEYLKNCHYNSGKDELCPIFRLGHIVNAAGYTFDELAYKVTFYFI